MLIRGFQIYYAPDGVDAPPPAPPGSVPPPPADTWYGKIGIAPEHHEFIKGKEYSDINTVLASHRNLESMIGRNRLAVPQNADDKESYEAIYRTLGRPDKPEYKLPEKIEFKDDAWKAFQPVAHQAGLSQSQVEAIATWYHGSATAQHQATETERANAEARDIATLEKEWGSNLAANKDIAARAFRSLGLDQDTTDKIEKAIGYRATMQLMHKIGAGLKEDSFHQDPGKGSAGAETVDALQTKINGLLKDTAFVERYNNHDPRVRKGAIEEMEALQIKLAEVKQKAAQR